MRKSLAIFLFITCALTALICWKFRPLSSKMTTAAETTQTATVQLSEPPVPASETASNSNLDAASGNVTMGSNASNGLITFGMDTEFNQKLPSPEAAKKALAMNEWLKKQHVGQ